MCMSAHGSVGLLDFAQTAVSWQRVEKTVGDLDSVLALRQQLHLV